MTGEGKRTIKKDFYRFCGWGVLETTANNLSFLTRALFCTLFCTGGRATEVLSLKPEQFDLRDKLVMISRMKVLKRRRDWDRTFPVRLSNPLVQPMLDRVKETREGERIFPYKYHWLYQRIRDIEKPDGANYGPWWPHRIRAERATQLVVDRGFNTHFLLQFFGWGKPEMAAFYVTLTPQELIDKMLEGEL